MQSVGNTVRNALRPGYMPVLARKAFTRIVERDSSRQRQAALGRCREEAQSVAEFAQALDSTIWQEAIDASAVLERQSAHRLPAGVDMGGGGHYPLAYFLTRILKPEVVVETGVAAGWTSAAILNALRVNRRGHLWSSDFPYFRQNHPENWIGCLVDDSLKENWTLLVAGDARNLPAIRDQLASPIDLFFYDSDKSYAGRRRALDLIVGSLASDSIVLIDDVQDNNHFFDFTSSVGWAYAIFDFRGYFAGMTGPGAARLLQQADPHSD